MTNPFEEISKIESSSGTIPPFLLKLNRLVDDPETDDVIRWGSTGQSFVITDTIEFTKELLPSYFKHNNLASFIRQLNMYGFHKVTSIEATSLKNFKNSIEFANAYFIRDHPYLMENIKRKLPSRLNPSNQSASPNSSEKHLLESKGLVKILSAINDLKAKQLCNDRKLATTKRENEALWRELAILRQKHLQQERIINRLIQFMLTMVRPSPRNSHVPLQRRYQLMLDDAEESPKSKPTKGPTIRELNAVEPVSSRTPNIGRAQQFIKQHRRGVEAEGIRNAYVVTSPDTDNIKTDSPSTISNESDLEGAAMTPISPYEVNPIAYEIIVPSEFTQVSEDNSTATGLDVNNTTPSTVSILNTSKAAKCPTDNSKPTYAVRKISSNNLKIINPKRTAAVSTPDMTKNTKCKAISNINQGGLDSHRKRRKMDAPKKSRKRPSQDGSLNSEENLLQNVLDMINSKEGDTSPNGNFSLTDDSSNDNVGNISLAATDEVNNMAVATSNASAFTNDVTRDLTSHIDQTQDDIDILKELLKGDNYNLDASTLLELFNDDPLNLVMPPSADDRELKQEQDGQAMMMSYNTPSYADFADLLAATPVAQDLSYSPPNSPTPSGLQTPTFTSENPLFSSKVKNNKMKNI